MRRSLFTKIGITIAAVFIALLIVEILLHLTNYHPRFMEMEMFVEEDNALLPYTLKPNYEGYQVGKFVKLDNEGNRIIPSERISSISEQTILILGDSVVFGFGLQNEETIASQLQRLINRNNSKYTVKNIGAPGYTTWNEYEALKKYLNDHKVDIVVLFYVFNDVTMDNNALISMRKDQTNKFSPIKRTLYRNIYSLSLIKEIFARINSDPAMKEDSGSDNDNVVDQLYSAYLNQEALDYSMDAISKIKYLCDKNGIVLIVAIPRFHMWYYNYPEFSKDFESEVIRKLNEIGVDGYIAKSHVDNLSVDEINVYTNDHHPSALAVEYIVNEIYQQIEPNK